MTFVYNVECIRCDCLQKEEKKKDQNVIEQKYVSIGEDLRGFNYYPELSSSAEELFVK